MLMVASGAGLVALIGPVSPLSPVAAADDGLVITPDHVTFDGSAPGPQAQPLTVRNGAAAGSVTITRVRLEQSGHAFSISQDTCSGATLAPGAACTLRLVFVPDPTTERVSLVFETGDATHPPATLAFSVGVPPPTTTVATPTTQPTNTTTATVPPSRTTVPRPTTTVSDKDRLDECERRAQSATVSYEPRLQMVAGQTAQVRVTASIDAGEEPTIGTGPTRTTVETARLRCRVQARLYGVDFKIDPEGFQPGSFLDGPTIDWSWDVVPAKPGPSRLTLEIQSVAEIEGRAPLVGANKLYTANISVAAQKESFGAKTRRWSDELVRYPLVSGLGSLVLVGGTLAGVWRWLLKRPWPWRKSSTA